MIKKIIISILIIFISCKSEDKDTNNSSEKNPLKKSETKKLTTTTKEKVIIIDKVIESQDSLETQIEYNIDYVKTKTSKLSKDIEVVYNHTLENKNNIPKEILTKYISSHKIDFGFPEYLSPEYPESYSFKEFREYQKFNLFTFTHDNETCCTTLYAVTTKKDTLEIINMGVIGYTGGDGGWSGHKFGKWVDEHWISSIEPSIVDDPFAEPNEIVEKEIDTTWSEIKINDNGIMKYTETKKVKYIGAKKIE